MELCSLTINRHCSGSGHILVSAPNAKALTYSGSWHSIPCFFALYNYSECEEMEDYYKVMKNILIPM